VKQMDTVVQQNASLVEEAAAATESMKEQAGTLLELVSRFRLEDAEQSYSTTPAVLEAPMMPAPGAIRVRGRGNMPPRIAPIRTKRGKGRGNGEWAEF
jgi:methyl-accepting chemotaxis protein